ncbi:DNA-binding transcriptional LysR family regulator [Paenibacillus cellulosilyticus]|uniref:DNA-binding transcriptional LysR family regulator n=1 Tax=Paenibacillus cellulosilyticus TaxID=375489 RepID=A0A2V2YVZ8_9BACL|nr:LysR family transcriptional regulator [Paenibacillus cellulosilyticus]PWW05141.1 DNA-binding transcriptional LysR family regulator [Paenibacillus cellulosilyticus]QKS48685.1 LysR family transcriptional regulator [Paenibacillus cellulosilyticus]
MLSEWDGRSIRTFQAVMEERSFSRAADKLGYVQSTVTTHIAQLEKASGRRLFDRLPRGVEPTDAGMALARFAEQFAALSQALADELQRTEHPSGVLRIRALESYCVARLPRILAQYAERYEAVELQLSTGFMNDICERVLDGRDELGIVPRDPMHEGLIFTPIVQEQMVWVSATTDRANRSRKRAYISYGNQCYYHGVGEQLLREAGYTEMAHLRYPSVELIKRMVQSGYGISLLPLVNVTDEIRAGQLIKLALPVPEPIEHGFIQLRGKQLRPAAIAFIEMVCSGLVA